jgi:hypothetical protein
MFGNHPLPNTVPSHLFHPPPPSPTYLPPPPPSSHRRQHRRRVPLPLPIGAKQGLLIVEHHGHALPPPPTTHRRHVTAANDPQRPRTRATSRARTQPPTSTRATSPTRRQPPPRPSPRRGMWATTPATSPSTTPRHVTVDHALPRHRRPGPATSPPSTTPIRHVTTVDDPDP